MTRDARVGAVEETLRVAGAAFALVFGSHARGDARPDSDLDVAAWFPTAPPRSWDIEVPAGVDLVVLNHAPLELAGRIALEGRVLFDDDPPARVRLVADTRRSGSTNARASPRTHREFLEAAARGR